MAVFYKTSVSHFNVKNTPLKNRDGKRKIKRMPHFFFSGPRKAFVYKIVLREIRNPRNFQHDRSERLACFETQPIS